MSVEAAKVVFGLFKGRDGKDGRVCLEQWLKKYCRDYRLRNDNGTYSADLLFHKPVEPYWLTQRTSLYAPRWGFERKTWDHSQIRHLSLEQYLQGPTPVISGKVQTLLSLVYGKAAERSFGIETYPGGTFKRRRT
jgi:hypothetical protein